MTYQWQELSPLGKWYTVKAPEPPVLKNGRIKRAEGQGPKVRNVVRLEDTEAPR